MILSIFLAKVRLVSEKPAPSPRSPRPGPQDPLRFLSVGLRHFSKELVDFWSKMYNQASTLQVSIVQQGK